jgi:hypothetical protein
MLLVMFTSELSLVWNWPFSVRSPIRDDEPGPPFSHSSTGSCRAQQMTVTVPHKVTRHVRWWGRSGK